MRSITFTPNFVSVVVLIISSFKFNKVFRMRCWGSDNISYFSAIYFFLRVIQMAFGEPQRIHPTQRIWRILIKVNPTSKPYWILAHKPARIRIIIAKAVIVQTCFRIEILPLIAQWLINRLCILRSCLLCAQRIASGTIDGTPDHTPISTSQLPWQARHVVVIPEDLSFMLRFTLLQT